ncbi:MAG: selenium metabolism-associated LysR family transcriptional regulator [bacterium]|nr:selenium metabolism-associated LysR family transcriptional regulator [bacterium]MDY4099550.1 selenium metabolism-associated LysR family transcriptional regulator [Lachnospiraceae bacterium]
MDFKQLQSFITVVKYGSFTKAAEVLYTSQPTISSHIRNLEDELSTRLLVRTTKSLSVTPHGMEFYEWAVNTMKSRDSLLRRWSDDTKRIIRLGASTIPAAYILPEILPAFGEKNPNVYFIINQSDSRGVIDDLLQGTIDIGFTGIPADHELLTCIPFYEDRMVIITPVNEHFLSWQSAKTPDLHEIMQEPVILREKDSDSKKSADYLIESLGLTEHDLNVIARVNDQESIKNLVTGGLGISIISEKAAQDLRREKRILVFQLPENTSRRQLYINYHKDYIYKNYMKDFIEHVRNFYPLPSPLAAVPWAGSNSKELP